MSDILKKILAVKTREVAEAKAIKPLASMRAAAEQAVQEYTNKQKLDDESFQLEIAK